jgi:hypothetical protein
MLLPCENNAEVMRQVQPTIDLLTKMDELYPRILEERSIRPSDYHSGKVFRSAVESIRGSLAASEKGRREPVVGEILERMRRMNLVSGVERNSTSTRCDFLVEIERGYECGLEVKGGEGNSVGISEPPRWAKEFCLWCHLDGAIVNQPSHGMHSVLNRVTGDLVKRKKMVDAVFLRDSLCGTEARPCPKYSDRASSVGEDCAPDIFLLPQRIPNPRELAPPTHTLETLRLPKLLLRSYGVDEHDMHNHLWEVRVHLAPLADNRYCYETRIVHCETEVDHSKSRPFRL